MAYGKIEKLFVGKDAQVRGTELTVISKRGGKTLYQHPLQRLLPFEIITNLSMTNTTSTIAGE